MAMSFLRRRSSIKKEFTENELQDLRIAFELLDRNQDGRVTTREFKIMLNNLGIDMKEDQVQQIICTASHSGKEQIDENDFLSFIRQIQEFVSDGSDDSEERMEDLRAAFQVFDLDGDGYITKEELRIAMEMIGEAVTEDQLTQFMTMADTDKDGRINYEEFIALLA